MTFTVTCRGADGSLREEIVEAASRAECFAQMRARGIVPVSVKEGRASSRPRAAGTAAPHDGRAGARPSPRRKLFTIHFYLFVAIAALAAMALWWWLGRDGARSAEPKTAKVVKDVKNLKDVKVVKDVKDLKDVKGDKAVKDIETPKDIPLTAQHADRATNKVVKLSPEDEAAFERVKRETSLRTQVENRMALLATIKPGMPVPPMPPIPNLEQDFEKAEANVIQVTEGDTELDLQRKQFVIALKERISAANKEGRTATEALNEYVETMRQVADFRQKSLLAARQMEREGDAEGAKKLVDSANADLIEMGAEPIDLHPAPKGRKKVSD